LTTIRTPEVAFHAEQTGAPPRAVFLHGFGGDLHTWDLVWPELGVQLSALRYDMRGYGQSTAPPGPYTQTGDLLAVLDACAFERCDLVGVSQGGAVALNFALDHPGRVRRLVLISPALVGWDWSPAWRARWRAIVTEAREGRLDSARRMWWEHPLFATTRTSAAGPALRASIERYSGAHWLGDEHRLLLPDVERLHGLAVPTLLLTGGQDLEDFRVIAGLIEAGAPGVQRVDEPALGHLVHLEDPRGTAQRIRQFLD
jgi:pimeloyl-ACP methyl ester carboxylesterase